MPLLLYNIDIYIIRDGDVFAAVVLWLIMASTSHGLLSELAEYIQNSL